MENIKKNPVLMGILSCVGTALLLLAIDLVFSLINKKPFAEQISSLSARGSINFPKSVTRLFFLARYPSKKSDTEARQKKISAHHLDPSISFISINVTNTGIRITRNTVILLGKFITNCSYIRHLDDSGFLM